MTPSSLALRATLVRRPGGTRIIRASAGSEAGSAAVELAVNVLVFVLGILLLASIFVITAGRDDVADAAAQSARLAAMITSPATATSQAENLARQRLSTGVCRSDTVQVTVDVRDFVAGGQVAVTVSCRTHAFLAGARTLTSTAEQSVDRYRGGP